MQHNSIDDIPDEILLAILKSNSLSLLDQKNFSLVSKKMRNITRDPSTDLQKEIRKAVQKGLFDGVNKPDVDLVRRAIECGANIHDVHKGFTPMNYACQMLFKISPSSTTRSYAETFKPVIRLLIEMGANPNTAQTPMTLHGPNTGETLLHIFCGQYQDEKMVEFLLEHHAHVDVKDTYGMTPLHYAANNANVTNVQRLLASGANVTITDNRNQTPLDIVDDDLQDKKQHPDRTNRLRDIKELLLNRSNQNTNNM